MLRPWLCLFLLLGVMWPAAHAGAAEGSLFARLFMAEESMAKDKQRLDVPYPLGALVARLSAQLAEGESGLRVVLIPVGRSLQRHSAGDAHYFDTPRAVIAVTGEPASPDAPLLKDRLYIGFHAAANLLEIISYNPGAGRFDFEIVDDYRAGGTPRLRAGNRGLCLACHQNDAPIFSRQSWDETSGSAVIAGLLEKTGKDYYGLPWRHGIDVPNAIDDATDRANLLPVAQTIWRTGCTASAQADAVGCRARLLWHTLLARLGGVPPPATLADDTALAPLHTQWKLRWPDGLPIPSPDIPNRQPFAATLPWQALPSGGAALHQLSDVAARFDPLTQRAPIAQWRADAPGTLAQVVHALGQFIAEVDVDAIDTALRLQPVTTQAVTLPCQRTVRGQRINIDCTDAGSAAGYRLLARQRGDTLSVDRLIIDGSRRRALRLHRHAEAFTPEGRRPRRGDGFALDAVILDPAQATLNFADDLAPLRVHLDTLAADTLAGRSDALDNAPLRRAAVLGPLLTRLGLRAPPSTPMIVPIDTLTTSARSTDAELAPFYKHCGMCHDSADPFPPGFLYGPAARVRERIDACAPRMLRRLAMWQIEAAAREKVPMPPPASAQARALLAGGELISLRDWLKARLKAHGLDAAALDARRYADLPGCSIYGE